MHQKLELNNAIERLLNPEQPFDREAAMKIVEFMRPVEFQRTSLTYKPQKKENKFTGFTREQGNVTIEDNKPKTQEYSYGEKKERVGNYKLWKVKHKGHAFKIGITPFWESELTTRVDEEPPDEYHLFYNEEPEKLSLGRVEYGKMSLYCYFIHHPFLSLIIILGALLAFPVTLGLVIGLFLRYSLLNANIEFNLREMRVLIIKGDDVGQKIELGFRTDFSW